MAHAYQGSSVSLQNAQPYTRRPFASQLSHCRRCKLISARRRHAFTTRASSENEHPDLIERIFGRIFGNKALEERSPGGMKRMSEEAMLEQYPATLTEFAAPVNSDDETMAMFRPLLAQTRLQKLPLRCAPTGAVKVSGGTNTRCAANQKAKHLIHDLDCQAGVFSCATWLEQLSIP